MLRGIFVLELLAAGHYLPTSVCSVIWRVLLPFAAPWRLLRRQSYSPSGAGQGLALEASLCMTSKSDTSPGCWLYDSLWVCATNLTTHPTSSLSSWQENTLLWELMFCFDQLKNNYVRLKKVSIPYPTPAYLWLLLSVNSFNYFFWQCA